MRCLGSGLYRVIDRFGASFDIPMWYCPGVAETLISPDHVCRVSEHYTLVGAHHDVERDVGHIRCSSESGLSARELSLTRANGLWYIARLVPGMETLDTTLASSRRALVARMPEADAQVVLPDAPTGPAPVLRVQHPQTMSKLWYQRLGHPGMTQLAHLQRHATGLPSPQQLHAHPLRACQVCHDARVRKQPAGYVQTAADIRPGSRFHPDFGSMRASSEKYQREKGKARSLARRLQCLLPYHGCLQPIYLVLPDHIEGATRQHPRPVSDQTRRPGQDHASLYPRGPRW
jgi:hypothetical protein